MPLFAALPLAPALGRPEGGALPPLDGPLGPVGWATGLLVLFALALIGGLWLALEPARQGFAALDDRGIVLALAPRATDPALDEGGRARAYHAVRRDVLGWYRAHEGELAPIVLGRPTRDVRLGLARLAAWTALKRRWAEALAREGLSPSDYHALARGLGAPEAEPALALDRLLAPPEDRRRAAPGER